MLDTVKIKIKNGNIDKLENFSPEFKRRIYENLTNNEKKIKTRFIKKFILRPNLIKDTYIPKVEIYEKIDSKKNRVIYDVLIEFSAPKILLGNNLEEISESDFKKIISKLKHRLNLVGVHANENTYKTAIVSKVHFGKNIILPDKYSMESVISELKTTNMGKPYDSTEKIMTKNRDEIFHIYAGTRAYVFYDKIRDILNRKIKSADKHTTTYEKELVESYQLEHKEILRYEYRLKHYQTVKSEINKILGRTPKDTVIFQDLFDENLWKTIINKSWSKIVQRPENILALIFDKENKKRSKNIIRVLFTESAKIKKGAHAQNLAFISLGLGYMANEFGMKFITKESERVWSKRSSGERLKKKIKDAVNLLDELEYPDNINYVDIQIKNFKRLTQQDLELMI